MTDPNPYAPPAAAVADVAPASARAATYLRLQRSLFGACVVLQLAGLLLYSPWLLELARVGAVSVLTFASTIAGSLCLYAAAALVFTGRARGAVVFGLAALFLSASLPGWGLRHAPGWLAAYGALLGLYGIFVVHRLRTVSSANP